MCVCVLFLLLCVVFVIVVDVVFFVVFSVATAAYGLVYVGLPSAFGARIESFSERRVAGSLGVHSRHLSLCAHHGNALLLCSF